MIIAIIINIHHILLRIFIFFVIISAAQALADSRIKDREVIVIESDHKGTQKYDYTGSNWPYIEVKNAVRSIPDKHVKNAFRWIFKTYDDWKKETANLQKYKQARYSGGENGRKTAAASGWLDGKTDIPYLKNPNADVGVFSK